MNHHSAKIGYIKIGSISNIERFVSYKNEGGEKSEIRDPKSKIEMAERTGLEPASGFPR